MSLFGDTAVPGITVPGRAAALLLPKALHSHLHKHTPSTWPAEEDPNPAVWSCPSPAPHGRSQGGWNPFSRVSVLSYTELHFPSTWAQTHIAQRRHCRLLFIRWSNAWTKPWARKLALENKSVHAPCTLPRVVNRHGLGVRREEGGCWWSTAHIPTFPHPTCRAEEGMAEETHRSQTRPWNSVVLRSRSLTLPFFLLKIQALEESYKYCTGSIVPTPQCCSHIHMGTSRTHPRVRVTHSWHAWTVNHIYQYRNHRPTKPTPLMHCPITPKKIKL